MSCITEMSGIRLVLFDMNNRIFRPYLAAIHRILISAMMPGVTIHRWRFMSAFQTGTAALRASAESLRASGGASPPPSAPSSITSVSASPAAGGPSVLLTSDVSNDGLLQRPADPRAATTC
jgi:hypothetical protein